VSTPAELIASIEPPSALIAIGPLVMASSAGSVWSSRQSPSAPSRTLITKLPSGSSPTPTRVTSSVSATQPAKPGFSTCLTMSPVTRSSRYTSCSAGLSRFRPTRTSLGYFFSVARICACTPSNGVRSRRCMVCRSTSYRRQFSSPPVSCR